MKYALFLLFSILLSPLVAIVLLLLALAIAAAIPVLALCIAGVVACDEVFFSTCEAMTL